MNFHLNIDRGRGKYIDYHRKNKSSFLISDSPYIILIRIYLLEIFIIKKNNYGGVDEIEGGPSCNANVRLGKKPSVFSSIRLKLSVGAIRVSSESGKGCCHGGRTRVRENVPNACGADEKKGNTEEKVEDTMEKRWSEWKRKVSDSHPLPQGTSSR